MTPKFESGQLVHHRKFGYRGVVVSVDDTFRGARDRAEQPAPRKHRPWYHVLVDGSDHETYVAEGHLELDASGAPVEHPLLGVFFDELRDGRYVRTRLMN